MSNELHLNERLTYLLTAFMYINRSHALMIDRFARKIRKYFKLLRCSDAISELKIATQKQNRFQ